MVPELVEQFLARGLPMAQEENRGRARASHLPAALEFIEHRVQHPVTGEQHERSPGHQGQQPVQLLDQVFLVPLALRRIGCQAVNVQHHAPFVIERVRQEHLARLIQPEALAGIGQVARDRQRGGNERHRAGLAIDRLLQIVRDGQRGHVERDARRALLRGLFDEFHLGLQPPRAAVDLQPIDRVGPLLQQDALHGGLNLFRVAQRGVHLDLVVLARLALDALHRADQLPHRLQRDGIALRGLAHALAFAGAGILLRDRVEERLGPRAQFRHALLEFVAQLGLEVRHLIVKAMRRLDVVQSVQIAVEARVADLVTEIVRRDLFHLVRLVEEHRAIVGKHRAARDDVGEEEVVVDDEKVGALPLPPRFIVVAIRLLIAERERAQVAVAADFPPGRGMRVDLRFDAGLRAPRPLHDLGARDLPSRVGVLAPGPGTKPAGAKIILRAQAERGVELQPEFLPDQRQVFLHELMLEGFRSRGNDRAVSRAGRPKDERNEISQRFTGPGPRFDDEFFASGKSPGDRLGHHHLFAAVLEAGHGVGQESPFAEHLFHQAFGLLALGPPSQKALFIFRLASHASLPRPVAAVSRSPAGSPPGPPARFPAKWRSILERSTPARPLGRIRCRSARARIPRRSRGRSSRAANGCPVSYRGDEG